MRNPAVRRYLGGVFIGLATFSLAACGGKPSEGDIKDKLNEIYSEQGLGLPQEQVDGFVECVTPKLHDTVSEDGLETLMDVDVKELSADETPDMSSEDEEAMDKAFESCADEFTEEN